MHYDARLEDDEDEEAVEGIALAVVLCGISDVTHRNIDRKDLPPPFLPMQRLPKKKMMMTMLMMILPMLSFTASSNVRACLRLSLYLSMAAPPVRAVIIALIYRIYCRSSMIISIHRHGGRRGGCSGLELAHRL